MQKKPTEKGKFRIGLNESLKMSQWVLKKLEQVGGGVGKTKPANWRGDASGTPESGGNKGGGAMTSRAGSNTTDTIRRGHRQKQQQDFRRRNFDTGIMLLWQMPLPPPRGTTEQGLAGRLTSSLRRGQGPCGWVWVCGENQNNLSI